MNNGVACAVALTAGLVPLVADITPEGVESWLKIGSLAAINFILAWQLVQSLRRETTLHEQANELRKQLIDAINKCSRCPLAQAANDELIKHSKDEREN